MILQRFTFINRLYSHRRGIDAALRRILHKTVVPLLRIASRCKISCLSVGLQRLVKVIDIGPCMETKRTNRVASERANNVILAADNSAFNRKPGASPVTVCITYRANNRFPFFTCQVTLLDEFDGFIFCNHNHHSTYITNFNRYRYYYIK